MSDPTLPADLKRALGDKAFLRALGEDLGGRLAAGGSATADEIRDAVMRPDTSASTEFVRGYVTALLDLSSGAWHAWSAREAREADRATVLREDLTELLRALSSGPRTLAALQALVGDGVATEGRLQRLVEMDLVQKQQVTNGLYRLTPEGVAVVAMLVR